MSDEPPNQQRLIREWIDWELADKIGKLVQRHMKAAGKEQQLGVQIATLTLSLVAAVTSVNVDPAVRRSILLDVISFIDSLQRFGWDKNEGDQRRRPN